ncbi:MAG: thiol reductant ABC exporter subunit CydD [Propionibacteriales bacterium]|nr:thiol reductant ABC exporter subunit CydD [Propionibacteriales bacterium]
MRPTDPEVLGQLAVARRPLTGVLIGGVLSSIFVIGQAFALTAVIVAAVRGHDLRPGLVLLAVVVAGRLLAGGLGDVAAAAAAARVGANLRTGVAEAVLDGRTGSMTGGEIAVLATRGVTAAEPYLTRYLPALVLAAVLPPVTVVVIATQDLLSAVIVIATLPLVPLFGALVGLATRDRADAQWRAMASLSGHFVDVVRGLPTLVAFRRAEAQSATIRAITHRYRTSTMRTLRIAFASSAVLELVATLSVALVAVVVGVRLAAGHLDLRTALVVLLLAPEAYWPLRRVGAEFHAAAEGVATFETINRLGAPVDAVPADRLPTSGPELVGTEVGFTYPGRRTPTLEGVDLAIGQRSLTALAGPSGCGKSTLLALVAGLLTPTAGTLTRVGTVSWMPQRPIFLTGSIASNLRLGAPDATDEQLWDALTRVALAERVRVLGGLSGLVAEDGRNLSAGERARLALARVLVADRDWVLLDEPTAHLDPITQRVLLDVLVELATTSAVVVVAHDPAVLAIADRVIELPGRSSSRSGSSVAAASAAIAVFEPEDGPRADRPARFWLSTFLGVLAALSGVALTATAGWLIVKASAHPATLTLLVAIVGVRTFGLGRPVFRYAERLRSHDQALTLLAERRVQVYDAVVPLTPGRLGKRRGDVLASIVDDVDAVVDRELRVALPLRTSAAVLAVATVVGALILPAAGAVIGLTAGLGAVAAYGIARLGAGRAESVSVGDRAALSAVVLEAVGLASELRLWGAGSVVTDAVDRLGASLGRCTRTVARALAAARGVVLLASLLGVVGVALVGADGLASGAVTPPMLALLLLIPVALPDVLLGVVEAGGLAGRVRAAEVRLAAFAAMAPAVTEAADPVPLGGDHDVVLAAARLGWDDHAVLADLTLDLPAGTRLGVVGPSGCGKSTLAAALIRFIDPLSGEVALGGQPLTGLVLDDVRGAVGYVDDDPHVFATTVAENIRLARPGASDADVCAALDDARLGDWLRSLPEGLDTWLGDGHADVSGGERARLGLARSLLLDHPVIVLDEPVAHLDTATAQGVADDLLAASAGRTVVWITHSATGLEQMDVVLDLADCAGGADVGV